MSIPIAVQLYTIRDCLNKDLEGSLKELAKIGFKNVELAGLYNKTPAEFKKILDSVGLKAISAHVGIDGTEANVKKIAEEAKVFGYTYVGSSGYPGYQWGKPSTDTQWIEGAKILAKVADWAKQNGLTYVYHNHAFEFEKLGTGKTPMDLIYPEKLNIHAELDVAWVKIGGQDPVAWINRLGKFAPLLHIKDAKSANPVTFAEVGTGIVDIKGVVAAAKKTGVKYLIIEQDSHWNGTPLESVAISYNNLKKIVG